MLTIVVGVVDGVTDEDFPAAVVLLVACWVVATWVVEGVDTGATAIANWSPTRSSRGVEYPVEGT